MKKFEYLVFNSMGFDQGAMEEELDELGTDGWEVITSVRRNDINADFLIMKRRIQ